MDAASDSIDIPISTGGSYRVSVQRNLLARVGAEMRHLSKSTQSIVITDVQIPKTAVDTVVASLRQSNFKTHVLVIPSGETHKSIEQICKLYDQILPLRIDRNTTLVALGGGMIGDMTGFVAATILRGVPFVQVPTSLLAMVDASVGGKTGVNHSTGKNLIGAFNNPIAVMVDPEVLKTLPPGELRSGLAECIKHEIIRDADGFAALEQNISRAMSLDLDYLTRLIAHNVRIKAAVVAADPFERGERAHLNFGHTFGHAIETELNYKLSHGACVGLGMCAAAHLSHRLGLLDHTSTHRIESLIAAAELPTRADLDIDAIVDRMSFDKKVSAGRLRFVLPDRIGHVVIRDDVPVELVRESVKCLVK